MFIINSCYENPPSALRAPPPCRGGIDAAGMPPLQGGGAQRAEGEYMN